MLGLTLGIHPRRSSVWLLGMMTSKWKKTRVTKECFLEALKYLKTSQKHPFETPGICFLACFEYHTCGLLRIVFFVCFWVFIFPELAVLFGFIWIQILKILWIKKDSSVRFWILNLSKSLLAPVSSKNVREEELQSQVGDTQMLLVLTKKNDKHIIFTALSIDFASLKPPWLFH